MTPETIDQIFVISKHWLLGYMPTALQPIGSAILSVVPVLVVFPLLFAITTVLERKGLGRIQNRYGPNRVGPYGFWQPIADGIKSLTKEDVVPRTADQVVHFLAPLLLVLAAFLGYAVLPIGKNMVITNLNAGVLFFFAVGSMVELAVFMAGWSSRSKYSLLGAMRAVAQMISYEVPLVLAAIVIIMASGSLSTVAIVNMQATYTGIWPHWFLFTPWGFAGFILFMIAATAESNRAPFDLPEGESEIIAGYYIEYSGFKFALFFLGEYLGMFATSGLAITLFLGGWAAPFSFLTWIPSYIWFFLKLLTLIAVFIWVRGTFPRLRMDQLMGLAWKFMLPMTLLNIFTAGIWHFIPEGILRWLVCSLLIVAPWILLSRGLKQRKKLQVRTYRFAE
ncbi:NADH-quinone oxidoreductase subunit NuoH [Granulicella arctica]|uniref:NADH-quinone oxidoreductase subunit H n=1 Tax=Granulicella arctica TaxID=940613 RepID=A0A7Y9PE96_9BACT|nr:NADH-quinone oxidoreductase subunit NuoH [Granulicella arctica]NYF78105.1 NADH-quinone oxidoreductase subunit H [Granulicella arctica]